MKNKLGVSESKLLIIERDIVNTKLNLLDEAFTFNKKELDLEYLLELHKFLFCDFYFDDDLGLRPIGEDEILSINDMLNQITDICINDSTNIDSIIALIQEIWHFQPFIVGNTRTLIAYLTILNNCFLLGQDINVNEEIVSNPNTFKTICNVNQKRLTK